MFTAILPNTSASVFSGYHEERKKKNGFRCFIYIRFFVRFQPLKQYQKFIINSILKRDFNFKRNLFWGKSL